MHYAPTLSEADFLMGASPQELLDYFLTRAMECEEIWGLSNASGWVMREHGETTSLPVWNYDVMANACASGDWSGYAADATSLEHFVFGILPKLQEMNAHVELLASPERNGVLITANALFEIFERRLDREDYFLEG